MNGCGDYKDYTVNDTLQLRDSFYNVNMTIKNPVQIYSPAVPPDAGVPQDSAFVSMNGGPAMEIKYAYPQKPKEDSYEYDMWKTIDEFEGRAWSSKAAGLKTGFKTIDNGFDGGISSGFIIIGGGSNTGKSAILTQIAWNISVLNNDVFVMDFSLDDPMPDKIARVAAAAGGIPINAVKNPMRFKNSPSVLMRRKAAMIKIRENIANYRAYDAKFGTCTDDVEAEIENKLIYFKTNNINKKLVVCIDNFHDLNIKGRRLDENEKFNEIAQWCADIAIKFDIPVICTAELKKLGNGGQRRPTLEDIRNSIKIQYEAKAILLVYNDVHYRGGNAELFFNKGPGDTEKHPVFELHFAKNKFHTYKGRLFFKFYPEFARMTECSAQESATYETLVHRH